jgi:hypothetical protein
VNTNIQQYLNSIYEFGFLPEFHLHFPGDGKVSLKDEWDHLYIVVVRHNMAREADIGHENFILGEEMERTPK